MSGVLRQPSRVTCGAAVAVRAEMLVAAARRGGADSGWHPDAFAKAVLATHLALTSPRSGSGRWQSPWPQLLGTPPWALASHLAVLTARPYRVVPVLHRAGVWARLFATASHETPVPLYVGSRTAPRHVVLAHGTAEGPDGGRTLTLYEPSRGVDVALTRHAWVEGPLGVAGWSVPWLAVLPRD